MRVSRVSLVRLVGLVAMSALLGSGCTSMHPVAVIAPAPAQTATTVKVGDHVRVTMRDGRLAEFTVEQVDVLAITARGGEKYATEDIVTLERRSVSAAKTGVLIVSVAGMVLLLLYAAASASLAGNFGS